MNTKLRGEILKDALLKDLFAHSGHKGAAALARRQETRDMLQQMGVSNEEIIAQLEIR
jgi:hypothetical protein